MWSGWEEGRGVGRWDQGWLKIIQSSWRLLGRLQGCKILLLFFYVSSSSSSPSPVTPLLSPEETDREREQRRTERARETEEEREIKGREGEV